MLEKTILGITALLLVGVAFVFRDTWRREIQNVYSAGRAPAAQPAAVVPEAKTKPKANPHRASAQRLATEVEPAPVEIPKPAAPMPVASRPVIEMQEVPRGISRAELIDRFGMPTSSATWRDSKVLNEKLIYRDQRRTTAVLIQDGTVISSNADSSVHRIASQPEIRIEWD